MIVHNVEQGSREWMRLRMGKPTASQFYRIVTPTGKPSSQAGGYINELLAELIMGHPIEGVTMPWMDYGHRMESEARSYYALQRDVELEQVGFLTTDDGRVGASPDSLSGTDGLVEIKCPKADTHVQYLLSVDGTADKEYKPQLQGQLYVSGREWVDIISYHPEMPAAIVRMGVDEKYQKTLHEELQRFMAIFDERLDKIVKRGWIRPEEVPEREVNAWGVTEEDLEVILKARQ